MSDLIYLASPYSHENKNIEAYRFAKAEEFVAMQMEKGKIIFSPIVYSHRIAIHFNLGTTSLYWKTFNDEIQSRCDSTWVLKLPGWDKSIGVSQEIKLAERLGHEVQFVEPLA